VRQNLLYGRWFTPRADRRGGLDHVVDLLGIGRLLARRPTLLSGGEKQRVAIGRALLASPRLLLMDEPLASLDEQRKSEIVPYIERLRDESRIPIVYVSHSLGEVARLATTLVLIAEGKVAAAGPASDVMSRLDLLPLKGRADAGALLETRVAAHDATFDLTILQSVAGELRVPRLELAPGTSLRVLIRARDVMIALHRPQGLSALNVLPATIAEIGPVGGAVVALRLDCGGTMLVARLTRQSVETLGLVVGRPVHAVIKSIAFDRGSVGIGRRGDDGADASTGDSDGR
jgi:molybdate transport system ATP-binding protein